jgi:hypothetical protein
MLHQIVKAIDRQDHAWISAHLYTKRGAIRPAFKDGPFPTQYGCDMNLVEYAFYGLLSAQDNNEAQFETLRLLMSVTPAREKFCRFNDILTRNLEALLRRNPTKAVCALMLWMDYHNQHLTPSKLFIEREDYLHILLNTTADETVALFARLLGPEETFDDMDWDVVVEAAVDNAHMRALIEVLGPRGRIRMCHLFWSASLDMVRTLAPLMHVPHIIYWIRRFRPEWNGLVSDLTMRERCIHALLAKRGIPPELGRAMGASGPVPPLSRGTNNKKWV